MDETKNTQYYFFGYTINEEIYNDLKSNKNLNDNDLIKYALEKYNIKIK